MQRVTAVFLVVTLHLIFATAAAAQIRIIRAGRVWDGAQTLNGVAIVIDGDRFARILPSTAELPSGAEPRYTPRAAASTASIPRRR
jgi:hypothetical protein